MVLLEALYFYFLRLGEAFPTALIFWLYSGFLVAFFSSYWQTPFSLLISDISHISHILLYATFSSHCGHLGQFYQGFKYYLCAYYSWIYIFNPDIDPELQIQTQIQFWGIFPSQAGLIVFSCLFKPSSSSLCFLYPKCSPSSVKSTYLSLKSVYFFLHVHCFCCH